MSKIKLSDHFTYGRLIRFTTPSIIMMVFMSVYTLVDGYFVSNFVGKTAFAALNLVWPVLMIVGAIGLMVGAGGNAIIGKTLGEKEQKRANEYFSMLVFLLIIVGTVIGIAGYLFSEDISYLLGARDNMLVEATIYCKVLMLATPFYMVGYAMQSFFITAEKPKLGLFFTVLGGVLNIILDAIFILIFKMGLLGAALGTGLGQGIVAVCSCIYFATKNKSLLRLAAKIKIYPKVIIKSCTNGSSEMVANIAASVVSMLYNFILLDYYGENGVAAYGVLMYVSFIFASVFFGYAMGVSPLISFNLGSKNNDEMKNLFLKSVIIISSLSVFLTLFSFFSTNILSHIFVGYDKELFDLTSHALHIYSFTFLFMGLAAFGSAFFTALNNGKVSAIISFVRTFVLQVGIIIILPKLFGKEGIWYSVILAELGACILTICFIIAKKKQYHYI